MAFNIKWCCTVPAERAEIVPSPSAGSLPHKVSWLRAVVVCLDDMLLGIKMESLSAPTTWISTLKTIDFVEGTFRYRRH